MTKIILPLFVLAGMLTSSNAQSCEGLDTQQCNDTAYCTIRFGTCVSRKINNVRRTDFVSLEGESDKYSHRDYEDYYGEETENIPSVGDEYDYYGSDEGDAPASLLLDDAHGEGNAWSDEPGSSRTIEEKHQPLQLHSEMKTDFSSYQKTRLRGSASRNTYFSAISVGDDSRPRCNQLTNYSNECRRRPDCRIRCHAGARAECWCVGV